MRKIFTLVTMALMALAVNAKDYKGTFNISIGGGTPIPVESTVTVNAVETTDDTLPYDIVLNNFTVPVSATSSLTFEKITMPGVLADDTSGMGGYKYFQSGTYTAEIVGSPIPGVSVEITVNEGDGCRMNDENLSLDMVMTVTYSELTIPVNATFTGTAVREPLNQDFSDNMIVSLDGGNTYLDPMSATINVQEQDNGKYTLSIKNFAFGTFGVGNITATDIDGVEENGIIKLNAENKNITVTAGDDPNTDWSFGNLLVMAKPAITLEAEIEGNDLNAKITIPVNIPNAGEMNIVVVFGADYIAAGINNVTTTTPNASGVDEIYDLSGRKLNELQKGINIVRKADGTTVKVLKR